MLIILFDFQQTDTTENCCKRCK